MWHGSSVNPGMETVYDYVKSIQDAHGGKVVIELAASHFQTPSIVVTTTWSRAGLLPDPTHLRCTSVECRFPHTDHKTLAGLLLRMLHHLDYAIGSSYNQEKLPVG